MNKYIGIGAFALVGGGVFFWLTLPMWHWLFYGLLMVSLPSLLPLAVATAIVLFGLHRDDIATVVRGSVIGIAALCFLAFSPAITGAKLYERIESEELNAPQATEELRYMPYRVAEARGLNATNDSFVNLGEFEPLTVDDQLSWVAPREPNGLINSFRQNQSGVLAVKPGGQTERIGEDFTYGEGMAFNNNWEWQAHRENFTSQKTNAYYAFADDELVLVSPYVEWGFSFPVMVPEWGGVLVFHADGEIEDLSPEEAAEDERFEGERLYPKYLAKREMDAWAYKGGIWNAIAVHRDQTELDSIDSDNPQPYILPSENGLSWVGAASPYGRSYSTNTLFYIDARTGDFSFFQFDLDSDRLGADRSLNVLRSKYPNFGWGDTVRSVEPRPVIRGDDLFWMISVTNSQYSSISRTAFVNASGQNELVEVTSPADAQAFLRGENPNEEPENSGEETPVSEILDEIQTLLDELREAESE